MPTEQDAAAAAEEAAAWGAVLGSDPAFLHRPGGDPDAAPRAARLGGDGAERWWSLDESDEGVRRRVKQRREGRRVPSSYYYYCIAIMMIFLY